MPGAAGLGLLWQLRMTARAQTYFNSWMHLLRDAAGIGTLETGWDGEGNCWKSSQHHVLVEMRFVPGAGRAQRGAAAWPWCGRECTQLTHTDTTDTQHHPGRLPGSSSSLSVFLLTGELNGKPAVSQTHLPDWETHWCSPPPAWHAGEGEATRGLLDVGREREMH